MKTNDDGTIAFNLNNANIDQIIAFLTEITGKSVVKQKDANAQITVYSPAKIEKDKALELIAQALLLDKIAMVQEEKTIKLVPVDLMADVVVKMQPDDQGKLPAGFARKAVHVQHATVEDIERLVRPLVSKNGTLLVHSGTKQIIITDTSDRIAGMMDIIAQVDTDSVSGRKIEVFALKYADAEEIAPIVKSMLNVMVPKTPPPGAGMPGQPGQPGQPMQGMPGQPGMPGMPGMGQQGPQLDVVAYKAANWLFVVAPEELIDAAKKLVEDLDKDRPRSLTLRVIQVKHADARDIASQISPLFQKRADRRLKETVEVTADQRSSSLLVLSNEENYEVIKKIVEQLDTEESVQMTTRTFELQYADAEDIASQMNNLYNGLEENSGYRYFFYDGGRRQEQKTRFVPEKRTNSVIAISKPSEFTKIEEAIRKLDLPIDASQVAPRIYRVKFIDAKTAAEVLSKVFGTGDTTKRSGYYDYFFDRFNQNKEAEVGRLYGKVRFVPEPLTNSIIVTTNNIENFGIIEDFLKELDQVTPDAANTMVLTLKHASARDVADELNNLFASEGARAPQGRQQGQEGQAEEQPVFSPWLMGRARENKDERVISNLIGQVRVVPDKRTNSLLFTTAAQNFDIIRELVTQLDVPSPKVLVRVRLIEVIDDKALRAGTRISTNSSVFENADFDSGFKTQFGGTWKTVYQNGVITAPIDISALIQLLRRTNKAEILSEPSLVMNNNHESRLFVGSQIPFIKASQTSAEGALNQSFEYKNAGTELKITPNINEGNNVVMKIDLESSQRRAGEVLLGGEVIDTRTFSTELAVQSGETIVIGGIMRDSETKTTRRVPIVGSIPIVNLALGKHDKDHEITELIAFITPIVLRTPQDVRDATRDATAQMKMDADSIPEKPDYGSQDTSANSEKDKKLTPPEVTPITPPAAAEPAAPAVPQPQAEAAPDTDSSAKAGAFPGGKKKARGKDEEKP